MKLTNVKEMSASLLPEVRDEFERSFEQKEASKVVDTNGEAKEQVKSVDLFSYMTLMHG